MMWQGQYFDGKSAVKRDAEVAIAGGAVRIRPAGTADVVWLFDRLRWVDVPTEGGEARLAAVDDPGRLEIADPAFVAALRQAWPGIDRAAARQEKHGRTAALAAGSIAAIGALIYAAATFLPTLAAPLVPASVQQSIGDAAIDQIIGIFGTLEKREGRLCNRPKGREALDRLVSRLVPDKRSGVSVTVADMRTVNALAAPGGRLLVFRGLIDFADNAEEFAGVLAHEIGHALHHHPTQGMIREIGLSSTLSILTGSAGGQGLAGTAANAMLRTSYTRDAEREADDAAVDLLTGAGISTAGMVTLFDRLAAKGADLPEFMQLFSTHPRSEDRARHILERGGNEAGPAMSSADWQAIKVMCGDS